MADLGGSHTWNRLNVRSYRAALLDSFTEGYHLSRGAQLNGCDEGVGLGLALLRGAMVPCPAHDLQ